MSKVKFFSEATGEELEESINAFLGSEKKINVIDIKYCQTPVTYTDGYKAVLTDLHYSALLHYEPFDPNDAAKRFMNKI